MALGFEDLYLIHDGADPPASPDEVGFKAFNLRRMARLGIAVPPGFVIGTHGHEHVNGIEPGILGKRPRDDLHRCGERFDGKLGPAADRCSIFTEAE